MKVYIVMNNAGVVYGVFADRHDAYKKLSALYDETTADMLKNAGCKDFEEYYTKTGHYPSQEITTYLESGRFCYYDPCLDQDFEYGIYEHEVEGYTFPSERIEKAVETLERVARVLDSREAIARAEREYDDSGEE